MNTLDFFLLIPLVWAGWKGFQRGLIFELAMLIGMIIGFYIAFKFSGLFEKLVGDYIDGAGSFLPYLTFLLVFSAVILLVFLLARFLEGILKIGSLNSVNKVGGLAFGVMKIALALSILLNAFRPIDERMGLLKQDLKKGSLFYQPLLSTSSWIFPVLSDVQKEFRKNSPL